MKNLNVNSEFHVNHLLTLRICKRKLSQILYFKELLICEIFLFTNFCELQKTGFSLTFSFTNQTKISIFHTLNFGNLVKKFIWRTCNFAKKEKIAIPSVMWEDILQ